MGKGELTRIWRWRNAIPEVGWYRYHFDDAKIAPWRSLRFPPFQHLHL